MWRLIYVLPFLMAGALFSCNKEDTSLTDVSTNDNDSIVTGDSEDTYFVSSTFTSEISADVLKNLAANFGQAAIASQIKYGVRSYKIIYNSTYNGKSIKASGLMFVPVGLSGKAPLLSLQHGTTFLKKDAPSLSEEFYGVELFASSGYISIMPDFIGYGASSDIFHPYYDQKHSALAVIDMVKSAREFLAKEKIEYNDQLFLAGYSEGGYVTLAAAKEIEQKPEHDMKVTAVAAGAGGYDLQEMLKGIGHSPTYTYPSYLAFVLKSYITTYGWNSTFNDFFAPQYASALDTLMTGKYDGGFINSKLTKEVDKLFNPSFYEKIKTGRPDRELAEALAQNSVSGWNTLIPIRLYHGTKDDIVPPSNSEVTLTKFKKAGTKNVTLTLISGGGHGSSFVSMLQGFVPWFNSLKK